MKPNLLKYKQEDSLTTLWGLVTLNALLLAGVSFFGGMPFGTSLHEITLLLQVLLLAGFLKYGNTSDGKIVTAVFMLYVTTTCYEAFVWISGIDGVIHGALHTTKGAPFAFLFESPPYLYPLIRVFSGLFFVPLLRLIRLSSQVPG